MEDTRTGVRAYKPWVRAEGQGNWIRRNKTSPSFPLSPSLSSFFLWGEKWYFCLGQEGEGGEVGKGSRASISDTEAAGGRVRREKRKVERAHSGQLGVEIKTRRGRGVEGTGRGRREVKISYGLDREFLSVLRSLLSLSLSPSLSLRLG